MNNKCYPKITISRLQNLIHHFTQNIKIDKIRKKARLKYPLSFMKTISHQFISKVILFMFCFKFKEMVEINQTTFMQQIDYQLKIEYQKYVQDKCISKQFNFQYLLIVLVFIFKEFFKNEFSEIQYDNKDDCFLFLILFNLFIGTFVNKQTFKKTLKKFQMQEEQFNDTSSKFATIKKADFFSQTQKKYVTKNFIEQRIQSKKLKRKLKNDKDRLSIRLHCKQNLQLSEFQSTIKRHLQVKKNIPIVRKFRYSNLPKTDNSTTIMTNQIKNFQLVRQKRKRYEPQQLSSSMRMYLISKEEQSLPVSLEKRDRLDVQHVSPSLRCSSSNNKESFHEERRQNRRYNRRQNHSPNYVVKKPATQLFHYLKLMKTNRNL